MLATRSGGVAQPRALSRPTSPAKGAGSATEPAQAAGGETGQLSQIPRLVPGCSDDGLDELRRRQTAALPPVTTADQQFIPGDAPPTDGIPAAAGPRNLRVDIRSDPATLSPDGVSALANRVLNLITLNTWLPATLFTLSAAVLLQFRSAGSANLPAAVRPLITDPIRAMVLIIPPLVFAAVVMQAFSFEAIRALEGYWRRRGLASLARTLMIRRHVHRKEAIIRHRQRASRKAFYAAKPRMLKNGIPSSIVTAMEAQVLGIRAPSLTAEDGKRFAKMNWRSLCDAWRLAGIDHLLAEEKAYPTTSRVLPTKLGNVIRATEDRLHDTGGDLEGFALRRHGVVSRRVQAQHDRFRSRLGMFCTLALVSVWLVALTPAMLLGTGIDIATIAAISGSFAVLGAVSYFAALASAKGYCVTLRQMDKASRTVDKA
jgi:hypothetical protein